MKSSFQGFPAPRPDGGKTNFGNATPENVDAGVYFSAANYINALGTSTKKRQTGSFNIASNSAYTLSTLNFRPALVICYASIEPSYAAGFIVAMWDWIVPSKPYSTTDNIRGYTMFWDSGSGKSTNDILEANTDFVINNNGFKIKNNNVNYTLTCNWKAYA